MVANTGSTARDFLATERNFLTQCRLGLVFSLLSSSFLLRARIPTSDQRNKPPGREPAHVPFGYLYFLYGIFVICIGLWYYTVTSRRLTARRAFLSVTNLQAATVTMGAGLVFTTCIALLVDEDL